MTGSLSTLLADSLDYAGLFPPAGLDMPQAVAEYERHIAEDRVGMLASFVCPAARLEELGRNAMGRTWKLSILGTNAESPADALEHLPRDLSRIASFLDANRGFTMAALELRVAPVLLGNAAGFGDFVRSVEEEMSRSPHAPAKIFYELGWDAHWPSLLGVLAQGSMFRGGKIRTGGLEAPAFPSPEQVAGFVIAVREAGVPWKATAGLHHPLRRFHPEVKTKMHGFLNVFLGAALAYQGRDEAAVVELLREEDAGAFRFSDESATWREHVLDRGLLSRSRAEFAQSFGSCSYLEPIEDLKEIGLL
jgi:hypothetical protein